MNCSFSALCFVNKWWAALPLLLLIGSDGGRGDEFAVALSGTCVLGLGLTWLERLHDTARSAKRGMLVALSCGLLASSVSSIVLTAFQQMDRLQGPLGQYGLVNSVFWLSVSTLIFSGGGGWADARAKRLKWGRRCH